MPAVVSQLCPKACPFTTGMIVHAVDTSDVPSSVAGCHNNVDEVGFIDLHCVTASDNVLSTMMDGSTNKIPGEP